MTIRSIFEIFGISTLNIQHFENQEGTKMKSTTLRMLVLFSVVALLLPCVAIGVEMEDSLEVIAPGFSYYTLGTEAGGVVRLQSDRVQVAGGLFILENGYLSVGYEPQDEYTIAIFPAGAALTCLNSDLSVRWALDDQRLAGAWYTDLIELEDALLLGSERSSPERAASGQGPAPSLMLLEKDTGEIRWQVEGNSNAAWISDFMADVDGNILTASNGSLQGNAGGASALTLLDAGDGTVIWSVEYSKEYGMSTIRDICALKDGLLLYGDHTVLYTDRQGTVRGWFAFQAWQSVGDYTSLWLVPVSEGVVYLGGWEMEEAQDPTADVPYNNRTLLMMRITEETFLNQES